MNQRNLQENFRDSARIGMVLPVLRLLVLVGAGLAGYLLYVSLTDGVAAGCGEGDTGCGEVLASSWSLVLGLPVSGLALLTYVVMFFVSVHAGERAPESQREKAGLVLAVLGVAAGASGLWFIGLQLFVLEGVCLYCMAVHGCSLTIAGLMLWKVRGRRPWGGVVPAVILAAVQVVFPAEVALGPDFEGTYVGELELDTGPVLGDPDAPVQIAVLYDYNCRYCRGLHAGVMQALERYESRLSVLMLPTALDTACNHAVKKSNPGSETSCELTRLALAVWVADSEQFEVFDRHVVNTVAAGAAVSSPREQVELFKAYAAELVDLDRIELSMDDPRIQSQLTLAAELYGKAVDPESGHRGLPRVVVSDRVYAGVLNEVDLFNLLDQVDSLDDGK